MQIIKIGKSNKNDIYKDFINDITVSKEHCQIFVDDNGNIFLTDLNSTNGTFVNNNKISEPVMLSKYDIVRAGNSLVNWKEFLHVQENIKSKLPSQKIDRSVLKQNEINSDIYINGEFNNKNQKYKPIKITNVCLLVLFMFFDMFVSVESGLRFNPLASLITFWISRAIIRSIFIRNPDFNYKILMTVVVYIFTFIIKSILLILIINSLF